MICCSSCVCQIAFV